MELSQQLFRYNLIFEANKYKFLSFFLFVCFLFSLPSFNHSFIHQFGTRIENMDDTILEHLTPNVQRRKKRSLLGSALSWFTEGSSAGKAVSPLYYISSSKRSQVETWKRCTQSVFKHKSKQIIL